MTQKNNLEKFVRDLLTDAEILGDKLKAPEFDFGFICLYPPGPKTHKISLYKPKNGNSLIGDNSSDLQQLKPFRWQEEFPEVIKKGVFDLIIGNPPYIRQEEINQIVDNIDVPYKSVLKNIYGKEFEISSTSDLAIYFMYRSYQLLKEGGVQTYLVSNKWIRTKYGLTVRKFLSEKTKITRIIDFTG